MRPLLSFCIDAFGTDRCMFASNFPVDKLSSSLEDLYIAFRKIATSYSSDDQRKMFYENAAEFYRL